MSWLRSCRLTLVAFQMKGRRARRRIRARSRAAAITGALRVGWVDFQLGAQLIQRDQRHIAALAASHLSLPAPGRPLISVTSPCQSLPPQDDLIAVVAIPLFLGQRVEAIMADQRVSAI